MVAAPLEMYCALLLNRFGTQVVPLVVVVFPRAKNKNNLTTAIMYFLIVFRRLKKIFRWTINIVLRKSLTTNSDI